MEFKVGMKVKATWGEYKGRCGVVVCYGGLGDIGVDFKGDTTGRGHSLGGFLKTRTGWWVHSSRLIPGEIVND